MPTCLVVQPIHPCGVDILHAAGIAVRNSSSADMAIVAQEITDCEAVITRNAGLSTAAINAASQLKVIANHGIGTNKIDVTHAHALNIPIAFTPYANARSVAEHALMLMLAVGKRLVLNDAAVRSGDWDYRYKPGLQELSGKTLAISGWGTIGRLTAAIAANGFGMKVIVHSPSADPAGIREAGAEPVATLDQLLMRADVLSLHRPSRPDTKHMLNAETLKKLKSTAIVVNTARADLIDTDALVAALRDGKLAGAGLDVFDQEPMPVGHPLRELPNVVLTPHTAGSTDEALAQTATQCANQIIDVLAGRKPLHLVDPAVWSRRRT